MGVGNRRPSARLRLGTRCASVIARAKNPRSFIHRPGRAVLWLGNIVSQVAPWVPNIQFQWPRGLFQYSQITHASLFPLPLSIFGARVTDERGVEMARHAAAMDMSVDETIHMFQRQRSTKIALAIGTLAIVIAGAFTVVLIAYSGGPTVVSDTHQSK